jgi:hypothetical protein
VREVRETHHGVEIVDPYRWMEDAASAETRAFLEAQDAHARAQLSRLPGRDALLARIRELSAGTVAISSLAMANGKVFYLKLAPGRATPASLPGQPMPPSGRASQLSESRIAHPAPGRATSASLHGRPMPPPRAAPSHLSESRKSAPQPKISPRNRRVRQAPMVLQRVAVGHTGQVVADGGGGGGAAGLPGLGLPPGRQLPGFAMQQGEQHLQRPLAFLRGAVDPPMAVHALEQEGTQVGFLLGHRRRKCDDRRLRSADIVDPARGQRGGRCPSPEACDEVTLSAKLQATPGTEPR